MHRDGNGSFAGEVFDRRVAARAGVVGGLTLISRVLGFVRDVAVAYVLGAGPMADAFFTALRIPNFMRKLFGEGSLTSAFIPAFMETMRNHGREAAFAAARAAMLKLLIVLIPMVVVAIVFARPLCLLLSPGFAGDALGRPEAAAALLRIVLPYVLLISGTALCMGILNALGRFAAPAAAPIVLNSVLIIAVSLALLLDAEPAFVLIWAFVGAGVLQFLAQQPSLRSVGFSWKGRLPRTEAFSGKIFRRLPLTVFGSASFQLMLFLAGIFASFLAPGTVASLYYADRLIQFPLGVFGIAVSTAALPSFSELPGDSEAFSDAVFRTLRLTLFITVPAAFGLAALNRPVVSLLFGRGAFGDAAEATTAVLLTGLCLGLPAFAASRVLLSAFFSRGRVGPTAFIALISLGFFIPLSLLLTRSAGPIGPALAVSLAAWGHMLLLLRGFKGAGRPTFFWLLVPLLRYVLLGGLMAAGILVVRGLVPASLSYVNIALIPLWAGMYVGAGLLLKMKEARTALSIVRPGLGKKRFDES